MPYPTSPIETRADGLVHAISIILGFWCCLQISRLPEMWTTPLVGMSVALYLLIFMIAFIVSGAYHMTPISNLRQRLRRLDHGLIFLRIASSFTPFGFMLNAAWLTGLIGVIWLVAIFGFINKVFFWQGEGKSSLKTYTVMSCAMLLMIWPMWMTLPSLVIFLTLISGAIYAVGGMIYARQSLPFRYPLWHICATTSSLIFAYGIYLALKSNTLG